MSELKSLSGRIDDEFAVLEKKFKDTQADSAWAGRNCIGFLRGEQGPGAAPHHNPCGLRSEPPM
jgi:hypothetical protein